MAFSYTKLSMLSFYAQEKEMGVVGAKSLWDFFMFVMRYILSKAQKSACTLDFVVVCVYDTDVGQGGRFFYGNSQYRYYRSPQ